MEKTTSIACPNCNSSIKLDIQMLLAGASFKCTKCDVSITLNRESKDIPAEIFKKIDAQKMKK